MFGQYIYNIEKHDTLFHQHLSNQVIQVIA